MDFQTPKLFISYKHLEAKTVQQLEQKMLQIQVSSGKSIEFSAPQHANNKWNTWYLYDFAKDIKPQDKLKMGKK